MEGDILSIAGNEFGPLGTKMEDNQRLGVREDKEGDGVVQEAEEIAVQSQFASAVNPNAPMQQNFLNAISFLQAQDASLARAGKVFERMNELKALSEDPSKNSSDMARYEEEFSTLQAELGGMLAGQFNGEKVLGEGQVPGLEKVAKGDAPEAAVVAKFGEGPGQGAEFEKYTASIVITGAGEDDRISASINGMSVDAVDFQGTDSETAQELAEEINTSGTGVTATAAAGVVKIEGDERFVLEAKATDSRGGKVEGVVRTILEGLSVDRKGEEGKPGDEHVASLSKEEGFRLAGFQDGNGAAASGYSGYSRVVQWAPAPGFSKV